MPVNLPMNLSGAIGRFSVEEAPPDAHILITSAPMFIMIKTADTPPASV
jgi:hypothetical protein